MILIFYINFVFEYVCFYWFTNDFGVCERKGYIYIIVLKYNEKHKVGSTCACIWNA